jgi:DNA-binding XRE family transcriptional regulator
MRTSNTRSFARLIRVSEKTARDWAHGKSLPELESVLRICYCFRVEPADTAKTQAGSPGRHAARPPLYVEEGRRQRPARELDKQALLDLLEGVLGDMYLLPPSMADVSRSLGVDQSHLRALFPEQCAKISERYLSQRRGLREDRQRRMKEAVEGIAFSLHEQGIYPSYDQVASRLSRPWQLRQRELHRVWKESSKDFDLLRSLLPPSGCP